jgi:hypothetical protein
MFVFFNASVSSSQKIAQLLGGGVINNRMETFSMRSFSETTRSRKAIKDGHNKI